MGFFLETLIGGLMVGMLYLADRDRLRADLQGLRRLQLRAGRHGAVRGAGVQRSVKKKLIGQR